MVKEIINKLMKKNNSSNIRKMVYPEDLSTDFQEKQALFDSINSGENSSEKIEIISEHLSSGELGNAMSTYPSLYNKITKECEKINGAPLSQSIKDDYWNAYERVSKELWRLYRG